MNKEEQREADIEAIAEVIYTATHGNDQWTRIKTTAKRGGHFAARVVSDYRLQAENLLASSWLDEKLEDARQEGRSDENDEWLARLAYEQGVDV